MLRPFANTLLTHLFKHIPSRLTPPVPTTPTSQTPNATSSFTSAESAAPCAPQVLILYFAAGFLLVETFPRECEEAGFTRKLIQAAMALAPISDTLSVVYCVSFVVFVLGIITSIPLSWKDLQRVR